MANGARDWMWSEALQMLARSQRLQQQMFRPGSGAATPAWEPPVDVLETPTEVVLVAALPGVEPDCIEASIDAGELVIESRCPTGLPVKAAVVHRLELPRGRFYRRVPLPPGRYDRIDSRVQNGCLTVTLGKKASS
jgi:HSP20 family molecular chaperone IbpA